MRPIARIICWSCRQGGKQLFRIKDELGVKTENYVCIECKPLYGNPPDGSNSLQYYPTEEQLKRIQEVLKEKQTQVAQDGEKVIPIEGDSVVVDKNGEENLPDL